MNSVQDLDSIVQPFLACQLRLAPIPLACPMEGAVPAVSGILPGSSLVGYDRFVISIVARMMRRRDNMPGIQVMRIACLRYRMASVCMMAVHVTH
jgi:hypothetical protein